MEEQDPILLVHGIFVNFFGEENVDLQGQELIVHFPRVTVTNENDRSVDITHLWVKVKLSFDGTINGTFQMMRSEFTQDQFDAGYSHSHIPQRDRGNFHHWADPCLGNGPIRNTIASLATECSEDMWNLFCLELSKYVTVESLGGMPYMYLERIGHSNSIMEEIHFPLQVASDLHLSDEHNQMIAAFIPAILERKPFRFNFTNGSYGIAMSERDIFITLSNLFIEWYNSLPSSLQTPRERLFRTEIISKGKLIGNKLYRIGRQNTNSSHNSRGLMGRDLFRFKNSTIKFNIIGPIPEQDDPNQSIFLSPAIVATIIDRILRTINNKYEQHRNQETDFSGEAHRYL